MKNFAFILVLLLSTLAANALTVDQLLKEYSKMPDIQYEDIRGKELKALVDSVSTDVEKEALSTAKRLVVLGGMMDDEQREQLASKLNKLKDYSLGMSYSVDSENNVNPLIFLLTGLDSSVSVEIYSKNSSESEYLIKPVFYINMWGMTALAYLDGQLRLDDAKEFVKVTFNTEYSISPAESQSTPDNENNESK